MIAVVSGAATFAGAEHYLAVLMGELRRQHRFTVLVADAAPALARARFAEAGASVEVVPGLSRHSSPAGVAAVMWALKRVGPDLVHVNLTDQGDGMGALVAGRLSRRPVVATLHNAVPGRARWRERLSRAFLGLPQRTVAVSGSVGSYLSDAAVRRHVVIENGVHAPVPAADARAQLGGQPHRFLVCGLGRLSRQKGWDVLCRAALLVSERRPDVDFVVLGEGEERPRLAAMAACAAVRFVGHRPEAPSLLAGADMMVLPSRFEALPLSLLEAMHLGVPVVASGVGGVPEAVGGTAVLVAPEDPDQLARAILALIDDPGRRCQLALAAKDRAQRLFRADRMASQTAAVYASLLR